MTQRPTPGEKESVPAGGFAAARGGLAALAFALALALAAPGPVRADDDEKDKDVVRDSVVKISASLRSPDPMHPWAKTNPRDVSGTGVVIEGRRILTNAHVVTHAGQIFVESHESSDKHAATVEAISQGMDLAVLKLEDDDFFESRPALPRSHDIPAIKDSVLVYGFPQGGSTLSVTKGIVSRVEFAPFGDQTAGLRVQVDAAINPGNSGGPALIDGKVIGLIFSKLTQSDNIGYIIPGEEIDLFLDDVKDGRYDGKPAMFDYLQTLENDALRRFLKLDRKATGMVVHKPDRDDPGYPLKEWDLISKIGEYDVDNTGMVNVRGGHRLRFQYEIQRLIKDGKVPLTVVRDGKEVEIELPVTARRPMLVESLRGQYPRYFIYGPLAFSPVSSEFLGTIMGADRGGALTSMLSVIKSPLVTRRGDEPGFPGEEMVVVSAPMLTSKLGQGYDNPFAKVVREVNGVKVKNLKHLVEILRDSKETFTVLSFDDRGSETMVFNHKDALAATEDILNDNGIRQRATEDLAAVWSAKPPEAPKADAPKAEGDGNGSKAGND